MSADKPISELADEIAVEAVFLWYCLDQGGHDSLSGASLVALEKAIRKESHRAIADYMLRPKKRRKKP